MTLPQPEPKMCLCDTACSTSGAIDSVVNHLLKTKKKPTYRQDLSIHGTFAGWEIQHTSSISTAVKDKLKILNTEHPLDLTANHDSDPSTWNSQASLCCLPLFCCLSPRTPQGWTGRRKWWITRSEVKTGAGTHETEFPTPQRTFRRELKSTIRFYT